LRARPGSEKSCEKIPEINKTNNGGVLYVAVLLWKEKGKKGTGKRGQIYLILRKKGTDLFNPMVVGEISGRGTA
jgi:hypothetical protein